MGSLVHVGDIVEGCGVDGNQEGAKNNCITIPCAVASTGVIYLLPSEIRPLTRAAREMLALVTP